MPGPPPRGFDADEYRDRTARAQTLMAEFGVDVMLLTTEPEIRYFTGFLTPFWQSPTRPFFLVLPASGDPIAVVPSIAETTMAATWLTDVRSWPSPRPTDEGLSTLLDALVEVGGARATLGLAMGPETHLRMPIGDFYRLIEALPDRWRTAEAGFILCWLRLIKSPAEVAKIAHVCDMVSAVFADLPEFLHAGVVEREAFRRFKIACLQAGVDDIPYLVGGAGPGGLSDIISPPSDRPLSTGDLFMLDTGCTFDGYWCDFDRTYAIGPPDDAARRAYARLYAATDAGLAAALPGASCAELYHAMAAELGIDADNLVGRLGHGLGMQLTEWPSIRPDDTTELFPGMVLTLEPSIEVAPGRVPGRVPGRAPCSVMVQEENVLITDGAPRLLTRRAPAQLPVL
ncbi:MAG: Xaa-Pro peptidase family protein [Rhodovibrio sp.]|nr:Xaa-Pro peptidase family protein [Rhodovibrio sp.]